MNKLLLMMACIFSSFAYAEGVRTATNQEIKIITTAVAKKLKDPESARISNVLVKDGFVCGMVNAKNSYGGYVGSRPFNGLLLSQNQLFAVVGIANDEADISVISNMCSEKLSK